MSAPELTFRQQLPYEQLGPLFDRYFDGGVRACEYLPGDRDLNARITTRDGAKLVFKVCGDPLEFDFLAAQSEALERVATTCKFVPRAVPSKSGEHLVMHALDDGSKVMLRAVTYLPGHPLAKTSCFSEALMHDLGQRLSEVNLALREFDHPALHRDFDWNLENGLRVLERYSHDIEHVATREAVTELARQFQQRMPGWSSGLPKATIHNDANDYNVMVADDRQENGERRISAIIDFGDLAYSYRIADLAVAAAYVVFRRPDAMSKVCQVIRGYHSVQPIEDVEFAALFDILRLRLCVSACMAAKQHAERPDDQYVIISQAPIRAALPRLAATDIRYAECLFRAACDVGAPPTLGAVTDWIASPDRKFVPVMGQAIDNSNSEVVDLSVAGADTDPECADWTHHDPVGDRFASEKFVVGRYNEPRLIYSSSLFATGPHTLDPRRTVHLGVDVFTAAGTPVRAPLRGEIVGAEFENAPQDYGGVIVLKHHGDDQPTFFTLYGHLSELSIRQCSLGQILEAGEVVGTLGAADENGGWTPHLHFQLLTSDLGMGTKFPGVVRDSKRAAWKYLSPNPSTLLGVGDDIRDSCSYEARDAGAERRQLLGAAVRTSYRKPLTIVRGRMQYLYDAWGRRYLDAYNNVPHVGHCHPEVVAAASRQMRTLNTNTRYLNDVVQDYATRLLATLPTSIDRCFFLNSASEANELALRLARAATGRHGIVVQDSGYHGHTTTLIEVSPYKHNGPGGKGPPEWLHTIPIPDKYRDSLSDGDDACGEQFAERAAKQIRIAAGSKYPPAALMLETCPSVGGQIVPPDGYLQGVYDAARECGALVIADEVQTGLGRMGDSFWAFEADGVVPDLVVMGKPIGNGHPLAAVATTAAIAESFDTGMEFFSTFGGNTVSCQIGLAVLDVIENEQLQAKAAETGAVIDRVLHGLQEQHEWIGDVRGKGLFWGVELVTDRGAKTPAGSLASLAVQRVCDRGILIGSDGPHHNVLKIRPPMQFNSDDAQTLGKVLDDVLESL